MPHVAVEDHRTAFEDAHFQSHHVPGPRDIQHHLLTDHTGRLTNGDQAAARLLLDDDFPEYTERAIPRLGRGKPFVSSTTRHRHLGGALATNTASPAVPDDPNAPSKRGADAATQSQRPCRI